MGVDWSGFGTQLNLDLQDEILRKSQRLRFCLEVEG